MRFPLPFEGRIALLGSNLPASGGVRRFDGEDLGAVAAFEPEALVAPLQLALSLADRSTRSLLALPSIEVAVVVLTTREDSPLEDHHRDLLWKAFRVPVFEQLLNAEGAVVARECEIHNGLHMSEELAPQFGDAVTRDCCECGSEMPRLISREHMNANEAQR